MRHTDKHSESGQTLVEYALLLACIALGCAAAALVLSGAIGGLFDSVANDPNVFNPPTAPVPVTTAAQPQPTSVEDCLDEGWRNYPQFEDQASCVDFVNGGG